MCVVLLCWQQFQAKEEYSMFVIIVTVTVCIFSEFGDFFQKQWLSYTALHLIF